MKPWVLAASGPVLLAIIGALWKLRTVKGETNDRLQDSVVLALAGFDRMAVDALVELRSRVPVTGWDRKVGAEDFEETVSAFVAALNAKRKLQKRFRRLLRCPALVIVGLLLTLPSGAYLALRGAGVRAVTPAHVPAAWIVFSLGVLLAFAGFLGLLYYESRISDARLAAEGNDR